jgi:hypothetical protein
VPSFSQKKALQICCEFDSTCEQVKVKVKAQRSQANLNNQALAATATSTLYWLQMSRGDVQIMSLHAGYAVLG